MVCVNPTTRPTKIKIYFAVLIVLGMYLFLFFVFFEIRFVEKYTRSLKAKVALPFVVVHLDLKGAPPKLGYLENLLPVLQKNGANALLIEYEDMFPYSGKLKNISSMHCYGKQELRNFIRNAVSLGFEIIPLIQIFNHMEHVLKLQEFSHLRKTPTDPDSICPSKLQSRYLITNMIKQIMDFHMPLTSLKYIHVGCAEVYHFCDCQQCLNKWSDRVNEFAEHLRLVANTVINISTITTTLFWDDIIRKRPVAEWKNLTLFRNTHPVVSNYKPDIQVSDIDLNNYYRNFDTIWIASAFKGADGKTASLPIMRDRFSNHVSWMNFVHNYKSNHTFPTKLLKISGIILTGWSRYSHMDPLCELLPVSIPSLILNLQLISNFKNGIYDYSTKTDIDAFYNKYLDSSFNVSFKCKLLANLSSTDLNKEFCKFDIETLYNLISRYLTLKTNIEQEYNSDQNALCSIEYYAKSKYINIKNVQKEINWLNDTLTDLIKTGQELKKIMRIYYEEYIIEEFVNYKLFTLIKTLKNHLKMLSNYNSILVWERNPANANVSIDLI